MLKFTVAVPIVLALAAPAHAQKLGVGGTGVDEASQLPICDKLLGTVALVEEKAKLDARMDMLPAHLRAMMEMAQAQQGGGQAVDPLLLKLLASRSRCFTVVDRGAGFDALQRERALSAGTAAAGVASQTLTAADYMLTAQAVYSNSKSRQSAGGMGGLIGGLSGLGAGALGGSYASSDMGKITLLALLDGFRKLVADAETRLAPR